MRIVIISDPARDDFHGYLLEQLKAHELYLLWHYDRQSYSYDVAAKVPPHVTLLYWKEFRTPEQLISMIRPDRLLFFQIIDFWQIPLIIAAHHLKVSSFFVEHGVGNSVATVMERFRELPPLSTRLAGYVRKIFSGTLRILHNRSFYLSVSRYLPKNQRGRYLQLPWFYKKYLPLEALSKLKFRNRTPHYAILFNRNNIAPFLLYNEMEEEHIFTEGVPFYDKYFVAIPKASSHLVFIEHPYLEEGILGWTDAFHEKIARTLEEFAREQSRPIVVKLHPRSSRANWERYSLDPELIRIRQREDVTTELLEAEMILGYSSTMLNVLIACKKNIVLLGWHPVPKVFGDDYSKTGLCHLSLLPEELLTRFDHWKNNNLTENNPEAFEEFIREYNHPFDGRATERTIAAVLNHEAF